MFYRIVASCFACFMAGVAKYIYEDRMKERDLNVILANDDAVALQHLHDYYSADACRMMLFIFASSRYNTENCAAYILSLGTDVNCRSSDGITPLMRAVLAKNIDMVVFFARRGADVNASVSGHSALSIAASNNDTEMAKILLHFGANIYSCNSTDGDYVIPNDRLCSIESHYISTYALFQASEILAGTMALCIASDQSLPLYVIRDIVSWLPYSAFGNAIVESKKVQMIYKLLESCRKLRNKFD